MLARISQIAILICLYFAQSSAHDSNQQNVTSTPNLQQNDVTYGQNSETGNDFNVERDIYGVAVNKSVYCHDSICVRKCCDFGFILNTSAEFSDGALCVEDERRRDFNPRIYKDNMKLSKKKANEIFKLLSGKIIMLQGGLDVNSLVNLYLLESGIMMMEIPNIWDRWTPLSNELFCIDHIVRSPDEAVIGALVVFPQEEEEYIQEPELTISGMFLSSVFLLMTLAVYSFLPQLRNLHGKVLMAYVASMLFAFLTMGTIQLTGHLELNSEEMCHVLSMVCYFSMQATFFWMNIMSFDIWWTFRGIAKARDINRRGENHKFLMYCLYGFGCPLLMTIIFAIINYLPANLINPAIITPGITSKGCFIAKMEKMLYLYVPISVMIAANCALFVATTCNLCAVRRATRTLRSADSSVQRATQNRLAYLYVPISVMIAANCALFVATTCNLCAVRRATRTLRSADSSVQRATQNRLAYLYVPISVMIAANCALFVATTCNLCAVRRATRTLRSADSSVQRATQNRLAYLYVPISVMIAANCALFVATTCNLCAVRRATRTLRSADSSVQRATQNRLAYLYVLISVMIAANCALFVATTCNLCAVRRATRTLRSADSSVQRATQNRLAYLYVPISVMIAANCALFVATTCNLCAVRRATRTLRSADSSVQRATQNRLAYLYVPISVMIAANCALFVATTCNLCAVRRATRTLRSADSSVQRATQNRFILYVKVFLLMGVSWSLEVASLFSPKLTVWKFTDAWNLLLGVLIFFIFVCKKKIFRMLAARYRAICDSSTSGRGRRGSRLTTSSTSSTSLDQDAFPTEVVTLDPKGHR